MRLTYILAVATAAAAVDPGVVSGAIDAAKHEGVTSHRGVSVEATRMVEPEEIALSGASLTMPATAHGRHLLLESRTPPPAGRIYIFKEIQHSSLSKLPPVGYASRRPAGSLWATGLKTGFFVVCLLAVAAILCVVLMPRYGDSQSSMVGTHYSEELQPRWSPLVSQDDWTPSDSERSGAPRLLSRFAAMVHRVGHLREPREVGLLIQSMRELQEHFQKVVQAADAWARSGQEALLYGRAEGGGDPNSHSDVRELSFRVGEIAPALMDDVVQLLGELEELCTVLQESMTRDQAAELDARARSVLEVIENIGKSAVNHYSTIVKLTQNTSGEARTLLAASPQILEVARLMRIPLPQFREGTAEDAATASPTTELCSLEELNAFVDKVEAVETVARTTLAKILERPFVDSQYEFLQELLWRAREYQDEIDFLIRNLRNIHRQSYASHRSSRDSEFNAVVGALRAIKSKEITLAVTLTQEVKLSCERTEEHLAAIEILMPPRINRPGPENHPLLELSRITKQYLPRTVAALNRWADSARADYPPELVAEHDPRETEIPTTSANGRLPR